MRILVACEYSGRVRDAFIARGHTAMSCDLRPTDRAGPHYQGDVRDLLHFPFDMLVAFPDCTYLCGSGIHWNNRGRGWEHTKEALKFVKLLWELPIPRIAIENPIGILSRDMCKPSQIIQPYNFGENASKSTCLWLKGLPKLQATKHIPPSRMINGKPRWGNQTDSGQNKLGPSVDRAKNRSLTYQGIADAMAEQWG